jgi:hypothetical protein
MHKPDDVHEQRLASRLVDKDVIVAARGAEKVTAMSVMTPMTLSVRGSREMLF